jgi:hypothetical protein
MQRHFAFNQKALDRSKAKGTGNETTQVYIRNATWIRLSSHKISILECLSPTPKDKERLFPRGVGGQVSLAFLPGTRRGDAWAEEGPQTMGVPSLKMTRHLAGCLGVYISDCGETGDV